MRILTGPTLAVYVSVLALLPTERGTRVVNDDRQHCWACCPAGGTELHPHAARGVPHPSATEHAPTAPLGSSARWSGVSPRQTARY